MTVGNRIHLSKAEVTEVEEAYVLRALRSGWVAPLGPDVDAFEVEIAERIGVGHALALSSGTAALHLALLESGAGPGTCVVMPSMTFAASANAVVYTGAEPVFVDAQDVDGNVDAALLLEAVDTLHAEGAKVAAAMSVDLFGRAVDYSHIVPELAAREIPLVEDAAEALGAYHNGRAAGSFGKAAALSFNGNKIMTTSGGGMLLSDDHGLIERARKLSTQAREPVPWYEHSQIGYNYRLSNILAALGRAQLVRLDEMISRRRAIRRLYREALEGTDRVRFLSPHANADTDDNCWLTCVVIEDRGAEWAAGELIHALNEHGVEARHLWKPMHLQPAFLGARAFVNGTSERLFTRGVTLPSGPGLSDADIARVIETLQGTLLRGAT